MTAQYFNEDINYGPDDASVSSILLSVVTQQGTTDTAVLRYDPVTTSSAAHFTTATTAAAGTTIAIIQPGIYIASMNLAIAAGACSIGISLGGTAPPFTTTPVATGTVDGVLAIESNLTVDASVQSCSVTFRIGNDDIDGTANVVRFMATVGGAFVVTQVAMRIDRATAH